MTPVDRLTDKEMGAIQDGRATSLPVTISRPRILRTTPRTLPADGRIDSTSTAPYACSNLGSPADKNACPEDDPRLGKLWRRA